LQAPKLEAGGLDEGMPMSVHADANARASKRFKLLSLKFAAGQGAHLFEKLLYRLQQCSILLKQAQESTMSTHELSYTSHMLLQPTSV
jgi:hypothetical protein